MCGRTPKERESELSVQGKLLVIITKNRYSKCMKLGKSPHGFCRPKSYLTKLLKHFTSTNWYVNLVVLCLSPYIDPYRRAKKSKLPWTRYMFFHRLSKYRVMADRAAKRAETLPSRKEKTPKFLSLQVTN